MQEFPMIKAPLLEKEELRIKDLTSYDILDSFEEKQFDDLVELAAQVCGCPIAAISFIDKERQWFKAAKGLGGLKETPRDIAFCAHTIHSDKIFIVENARKDERFSNNPLVTGGIKICFYAGSPIVSRAGYNIGAVCVIDNKPRMLNEEQKRSLDIISQQISRLLELKAKNQIIQKQTEELLKLEKQTIQLTLMEQENEKQLIGMELHENFAQVLTAVSLFLDMSVQMENFRLPFIKKAKGEVDRLVDEMRNLSKSIVPTTVKNSSLAVMVKDFISRFASTVPFTIDFTFSGINEIQGDMALALFRIIETRLHILKMNEQVRKVCIESDVKDKELSITITDDGKMNASLELELIMNTIVKRIELLKGNSRMTRGDNGGSILLITLPLPDTQNNIMYHI